MSRPVRITVALVALALIAAGCGLQPKKGTSSVSVTITRDFGTVRLGERSQATVPAAETVMGLLQRSFAVKTTYGGAVVQSIGGTQGSGSATGWFYYVNGVQAPVAATGTNVHAGDQVWWDLHDGSATPAVPAVVGSFPEPFVRGIGGTRYPTVLECGSDVQAACNRIAAQLQRDGVPVADQLLGTGSGPDTLNIVVATWRDLLGSLAAKIVAAGPGHSGIYATFGDGGAQLHLLTPRGQVARTLGAGAGLVAATQDSVSKPEWLVTGTDVAGVLDAAAAVNPVALHDRFALAVQGAQQLSVPLQPSQ